ncbi:MAG: hypothetical protein MAG715_01272 [Methanonatronarchaeales archaeon]|nr:hypothetical protein [Methanonatronarchaeales archaeon]
MADENVNFEYVNALRMNGYEVVSTEEYGKGEKDENVLERAADEELVLITNDLDFRSKAEEMEHSGVVLYRDQRIDPGRFVTGVKAIERAYTESGLHNRLEWLEQWIR